MSTPASSDSETRICLWKLGFTRLVLALMSFSTAATSMGRPSTNRKKNIGVINLEESSEFTAQSQRQIIPE